MKGTVQANIKRQKHQTSVKNVMFMSAKVCFEQYHTHSQPKRK